jgi:hypothetical protein
VMKMSYFLSWSDFDIDECPPRVLVEDDVMWKSLDSDEPIN